MIRESLWVDELHTGWVVLGNWSELQGRAAAGNQTPAYFAMLKAIGDGLGRVTTVSLRLPSVISWALMIWVVVNTIEWLGHDRGPPSSVATQPRQPAIRMSVVMAMAVWLLLDRTNVFYSIEARPYGWIALLAALLTGQVLASRDLMTQTLPPRRRFAWVMLSIGMVWVHLTAVIFVASCWLVRACWVLLGLRAGEQASKSMGWKAFGQFIVDGGVMGVGIAVPLIVVGLGHIAGSQSQWAAFAGDISPWKMLTVLPAVTWVGGPMIAVLVFQSADRGKRLVRNRFAILFVLLILPIAFCWAATAFEIAPLMHTRYLISCVPVMMMLGGALLVVVPKSWQILIVAGIGVIGLVLTQGTATIWSHGEVIGWQRQEQWRAAIESLSVELQPDDLVLLAPGLVELNGVHPELKLEKDYLQFSLHSIYAGLASAEVEVLENQFLEADNSGQDWLDQGMDRSRVWLLVRQRPEIFENRLNRSLLRRRIRAIDNTIWQIERFDSYGKVQLVLLVQDEKTR